MKKVGMALAVLALTAACSKVSFQPGEATYQKLDGPTVVDPTPVDPPVPPVTPVTPPIELPSMKTGPCADQQVVTSCLKCEVPVTPPPPPVISSKAQKLAKIMSMACQIYNKSYPSNYVAPTVAQIQSHLLACTPELYPETPMSISQVSTVGRLMDDNSDSLRQKMFKGLWYQPPYSDDFELYFGLESSEAAYAFCLNSGTLPNILYTSEYAKAVGTEGGLDTWSRDPAAQARWRAAQLQRQQLLSCFNKPGTATATPAPAPAPTKSCQYRSFEGKFEQGGREEIQNALAEGYKLAIETENSCTLLTQVPAPTDFHGKLKIAGYRCH